jgi:farnesyl-diphosphate farnesyltransferase
MPVSSVATIEAVFAYCRGALPSVSRTFALTIPRLDEPLRTEVAVCYLLCRAVDTVEDHPGLPGAERDALLAWILENATRPPGAVAAREFLDRWPPHPDPAHQSLMEHITDLFLARAALSSSTREALDACLEEMVAGMRAFPAGRTDSVVAACPTVERLDAYCHAVAGTVGLLLSRLFGRRIAEKGWLDAACSERGRRLGLGLQLTNILKDHRADAGRGVVYLPPGWLEGERPGAPLTAAGRRAGVRRALEHLEHGSRYILGIPAGAADMRIFCAIAHHLALATLAAIADPHGPRPPKISRGAVAEIVETIEGLHGEDAALTLRTRDLHDSVLIFLDQL